jgi:hypothetical protein
MTPFSKRVICVPRGLVKNIIFHTHSKDDVLPILVSHRKSTKKPLMFDRSATCPPKMVEGRSGFTVKLVD